MKVNHGQKVQLVIVASHFVISWFLILDFKCHVVSGYRYVSSSLYLDCGLPSCHFFSSVFHFVTSSSFQRFIILSLRMNRADLGTILTMLNIAAMKWSVTSGELKAFIRSNIQQILNGVNNNLMEEKDGINYFVLR